MSLYEISARYKEILDKDDLSFDDCRELELLHDNIEDDLIERAKYIRNLEAEAKAIDDAMNEMLVRYNALSDKAKLNRVRLAERMEDAGIKKITKSPLFAITLKQNPVSVDAFDNSAIPENYWRIKVTESKSIDKESIKKAIERGDEVAGARLIQKVRVDFK